MIEIDCGVEKDWDNWKFSSNINEVIRAVLNFFFFFTKRFCMHAKCKRHKKHKKHQNHQNKIKQINNFFPLRCFLSA